MPPFKPLASALALSALVALGPLQRAAASPPPSPPALAASAAAEAPAAADVERAYRLGYGDALAISSSVQPEFFATQSPSMIAGRAFPIRPDGRIALPLIGDVLVAGLTTAEVAARLAERYRPLLGPAAFVVNVIKFRTRSVTVLGEVERPGTYDFEVYPSFLEALARCGGPTEWAVTDNVTLVRGGRLVATLDLEQLRTGRQEAPVLMDRDVIFVDRHWAKSVLKNLPPIVSTLVSLTTITILLVRH